MAAIASQGGAQMQLFLQPASDADAVEHFRKTVIREPKLYEFLPFMTESQARELRIILGSDESPAPVWGCVPRAKNETLWNSMQNGDWILFFQGGKYVAAGIVIFKMWNHSFAKDVWGVDKSGRSWDLVYFLKNIRRFDSERGVVNAALGYDPNSAPRSILRPKPEAIERLLASYQSIDAFVSSLAGMEVLRTGIEEYERPKE
jgi:hypothetical protein